MGAELAIDVIAAVFVCVPIRLTRVRNEALSICGQPGKEVRINVVYPTDRS